MYLRNFYNRVSGDNLEKSIHYTVCNSKNPRPNKFIGSKIGGYIVLYNDIMEYHTAVKVSQLQLYTTQNKNHGQIKSTFSILFN